MEPFKPSQYFVKGYNPKITTDNSAELSDDMGFAYDYWYGVENDSKKLISKKPESKILKDYVKKLKEWAKSVNVLIEINDFNENLLYSNLEKDEMLSNKLFDSAQKALTSKLSLKYLHEMPKDIIDKTVNIIVENSSQERWKLVTKEEQYVNMFRHIHANFEKTKNKEDKVKYLKALNDAIEANPVFFKSYLKKALINKPLDFGRSYELLNEINTIRKENKLKPDLAILEHMLISTNKIAKDSRFSFKNLKETSTLLNNRVEYLVDVLKTHNYKLDANLKLMVVDLYTNLNKSNAIVNQNKKFDNLFKLFLKDDLVKSKFKFTQTGEVDNSNAYLNFKEFLSKLKNKTILKNKNNFKIKM